MTNLNTYLTTNQHLLTQIKSELDKLDELGENGRLIYFSAIPIIGGASIGAHLRHILDFYNAFYFGAKNCKIDYDDRQRNPETENELNCGIAQLLVTKEQLQTMQNGTNQDVMVNAAIEVASIVNFAKSNLIRELQSLHSHTTHHMAIIAIVLKLNDISVDSDFGKAPSTIQYEHSEKFENKEVRYN